MPFAIVFHPVAQREFLDAYEWYESQRDGLGIEFALALTGVLTRIADNPHLYAAKHKSIRQAVVATFPYSVLYRRKNDCIEVISIFHANRDPAHWQELMEE